jgi:hypothetical protein
MKGGKPSHVEVGGRRVDMAAPQRGVRVDSATVTATTKDNARTREMAKLPLCARSLIVMLLLVYADCAPRL